MHMHFKKFRCIFHLKGKFVLSLTQKRKDVCLATAIFFPKAHVHARAHTHKNNKKEKERKEKLAAESKNLCATKANVSDSTNWKINFNAAVSRSYKKDPFF